MPLTTLEALKLYLKISVETDNVLLQELIDSASSAIENYCKRKFDLQTYTDEEYDGNGLSGLYLHQYPVVSIASVTVDDTSLVSTEFKVKKNNGKLIRKNSTWPRGEINILVTYTAGYSTIPPDLELACKILIRSYYNTDIASFSTTFQEGLVFRADAMPKQVEILLKPYKKVM